MMEGREVANVGTGGDAVPARLGADVRRQGRLMPRRFLLWDHDGVLVDTERWY
jgi:hypothetical protein